MLSVDQRVSLAGAHEHAPTERRVTNGHRKWEGMVACRPKVFFAFGPDEDWSVHSVAYLEEEDFTSSRARGTSFDIDKAGKLVQGLTHGYRGGGSSDGRVDSNRASFAYRCSRR